MVISMDNRLKQQMDFILEVDKIKNIGRQTYLSDGVRKENDAEHSWHLALMALLLKEHATEEIDVMKVMTMVLDVTIQAQILELIKKIQKERNIS